MKIKNMKFPCTDFGSCTNGELERIKTGLKRFRANPPNGIRYVCVAVGTRRFDTVIRKALQSCASVYSWLRQQYSNELKVDVHKYRRRWCKQMLQEIKQIQKERAK